MMQTIIFTIPGIPVPKGRPRFSMQHGFPRAYTPKETATFENLVRVCYLQRFHKTTTIKCPISVDICAVFPYIKSLSKRMITAGGMIPKTTKPDGDNLIKAILDSLNGYAWRDDSLVYKIDFIKIYGECPRTEIKINYEEN
jgi:Holliday junction resolvase RusA-like endonuclease